MVHPWHLIRIATWKWQMSVIMGCWKMALWMAIKMASQMVSQMVLQWTVTPRWKTAPSSESDDYLIIERIHFLPIPLMTPMLMIQWKLGCWSPKQKQKQKHKNQPITKPCLFLAFCLQLRQSSFHWIISIRVISGIGRKWNCSDSAYNSDFWFSPGRKLSYNSDSNSVASENQP